MSLRQPLNYILVLFLIMCLCGCTAQNFETQYEMNFHGRNITPSTGNTEHSYMMYDHSNNNYKLSLSFEKCESDKKVPDEYLTFDVFSYTHNKKITFEKILFGPALSRHIPVPRAEFTKENTLLVYFENWRTQFVIGYVNGTLSCTNIFEFDLTGNGAIIKTWKADENEFIVTGENRELYIYNMGRIYIRNLNNWNSIKDVIDLGLKEVKADIIKTLLFEVDNDEFRIYKINDRTYDSGKEILDKTILATIQTIKIK